MEVNTSLQWVIYQGFRFEQNIYRPQTILYKLFWANTIYSNQVLHNSTSIQMIKSFTTAISMNINIHLCEHFSRKKKTERQVNETLGSYYKHTTDLIVNVQDPKWQSHHIHKFYPIFLSRNISRKLFDLSFSDYKQVLEWVPWA